MTTPVGLLDAILRDALDPSYAQAAKRRHALLRLDPHRRSAAARRRGLVAGVPLLVAAGALAGLAIASQQKTIPQVGAARNALAGNARQLAAQVGELESTLSARQREVSALQQANLQSTAAGQTLQRQAAALQQAAAQVTVTGPGVALTITDAPSARTGTAGSRPRDAQLAGSRVSDRELQDVVNAVWAAGAEAVSVSGIRLGPQTSIRTAGQTILVDFHAVQSPYRIAAIGPPGLQAAIRSSPTLASLSAGAVGTHPGIALEAFSQLALPAASSSQPRVGRPLTRGPS